MAKNRNPVAEMVESGHYRLEVTDADVDSAWIRYDILEDANRVLGDVTLMVRILVTHASVKALVGRKYHAEVFVPGDAYGDGWTPHRPAAGACVRDLALLGTS